MSQRIICLLCFFMLQCPFAQAQQPTLMLPIGHTGVVGSAGFSPDGKLALTSSTDNTAKIWNAATGKLLGTLAGFKEVPRASFSPDGKAILVRSTKDFFVTIQDAATLQERMRLTAHTKGINDAGYTKDGSKIFTGSADGTVKIWDALTGKLLTDIKNNAGEIYTAQFSPDGKKIAVVYQNQEQIIWEVQTGLLLSRLKSPKEFSYYALFDNNAKRVVTCSGGAARIWDAATGDLIKEIKDDSAYLYNAYFSTDGKKIIATISWGGGAIIFDAEQGKRLQLFKKQKFDSYAISSDGKKMVTAEWNQNITVWDLATGNSITSFDGSAGKQLQFSRNGIYGLGFSTDGKQIIAGYNAGEAIIWNIATGNKRVAVLKGNTNYIGSSVVSPAGDFAATVSGGAVRIWDIKSGKIISRLADRFGSNVKLSFNKKGNRIFTHIYDDDDDNDEYEARLWDIATGTLIKDVNGDIGKFEEFKFSPDGNTLAVYDWYIDETYLWDTETGDLKGKLAGHRSGIVSATFSDDSKTIITTSMDSTARVWNCDNGKLMLTLSGHTKLVSSAEYNVGKTKIVTSSWDSTAKIWDAATGQELLTLKGHKNGVTNASFNASGTKIVTASYDTTVKIWDAGSGNKLCSTQKIGNHIQDARFVGNGSQVIISADYMNQFWDMDACKMLADYRNTTYIGANPDQTKMAFHSYNPKEWGVLIRDVKDGSLLEKFEMGINGRYGEFSWEAGKLLLFNQSELTITDIRKKEKAYSFIAVDSTDYLVYNKNSGIYDGTAAARKLLYFTCGTEVISLEQLKDQLWVPNLAERIMKGDTINSKTIADLNICGLTPEVQEAGSTKDMYRFKITPRKGGLGETVVHVNGIEVKKYQPAALKKLGSSYELLITRNELSNFFIAGQQNPVSIKSYIANNSIASRSLIPDDEPVIPKNTTPPNLYAVMVGVSDYKGDEMDLKFAAKDATDISAAVSNAAQKLLNTDGKQHVFMYNLVTNDSRYQLPEKNGIKKILEEIGKKSAANDIVLIFFAGHGVMEEPPAGDTKNKKKFYFLTADASQSSATLAIADVGISMTELTDWIKPQRIKAQKRILIFDACNSGQAINDFVKMGGGQDYFAARNDDKAQVIKAIDKLNEQSGLFILAASASSQSAYEMGRYSQGLLTYSLLRAIKLQPDILEDGKYLDVSRWFNAAEKTVTELTKENGARQQPQIVSNTNFNIGIVDEDIVSKIILPQEKPLFTNSNLQNADENIAMDDLELNKLLDTELAGTPSKGDKAVITYIANLRSADAYALGGRYEVTGDTITARINIRKGKEIKYKFELSRKTNNLTDLAQAIITRVIELVK
jgi:WD40 repeat protein/uncharacterized caspase-like protein